MLLDYKKSISEAVVGLCVVSVVLLLHVRSVPVGASPLAEMPAL